MALSGCVVKSKAWATEGSQGAEVSGTAGKQQFRVIFSVWCQFCVKHKDKDYLLENGHLLNKCRVKATH